jgi:hypothetical protein
MVCSMSRVSGEATVVEKSTWYLVLDVGCRRGKGEGGRRGIARIGVGELRG